MQKSEFKEVPMQLSLKNPFYGFLIMHGKEKPKPLGFNYHWNSEFLDFSDKAYFNIKLNHFSGSRISFLTNIAANICFIPKNQEYQDKIKELIKPFLTRKNKFGITIEQNLNPFYQNRYFMIQEIGLDNKFISKQLFFPKMKSNKSVLDELLGKDMDYALFLKDILSDSKHFISDYSRKNSVKEDRLMYAKVTRVAKKRLEKISKRGLDFNPLEKNLNKKADLLWNKLINKYIMKLY